MTKLLAISGSIRRDSSNSALLRAAARAAPRGVELQIYADLGKLPIFTPDESEVLPAPVKELRAALLNADGLLIASPEYAHGVPGGLKNLLDWAVAWGELAGTPTALWHASVYGEHAKAALAEILATMSLRIVPAAELTLHLRGKKPVEMAVILDGAETQQTLGRVLATFSDAIQAYRRPVIA